MQKNYTTTSNTEINLTGKEQKIKKKKEAKSKSKSKSKNKEVSLSKADKAVEKNNLRRTMGSE